MSVVLFYVTLISFMGFFVSAFTVYLLWLRPWAFRRSGGETEWNRRLVFHVVALSPLLVAFVLTDLLVVRIPWYVGPGVLVLAAVTVSRNETMHDWFHARVGGLVLCAKCRYPRPEVRDDTSSVCPECANEWWEPPLLGWKRLRSDSVRMGVVPERWLRVTPLGIAAGVLGMVLIGTVTFSLVRVQHQPGRALAPPMRAMFFKFGDAEQRAAIVGERVARKVRAGRNVDAEVERFIEIRELKQYIGVDVPEALESAISGGLISDAMLDRFYSEAMDWTLTASLNAAGTEVTPELDLVAYDDTSLMDPYVITAGARVNDEPFVQASDDFSQPSDYANTFADWGTLWPHGAYDNHVKRSQYFTHRTYGFDAVDVSHLAPGEHTLTVRFFFYVVPQDSDHGFPRLAADGEFEIPNDLVWHETRDLTATFTIP